VASTLALVVPLGQYYVIVIYIHRGNRGQRTEKFNHTIICIVCIDFHTKGMMRGVYDVHITTFYVYLAQHEVQLISWITINKA